MNGTTILLLFFLSLSQCAVFYVNPVGTDSISCGGLANQCQTIQYAIGARAGIDDTINVQTGTYTEDIQITKDVSLIATDSAVILHGKISSISSHATWTNVRIEGFKIELAGTMLEFVAGTSLKDVIFKDVQFLLSNSLLTVTPLTKFDGYINVDNLVFKDCTFSTGTYENVNNNPFHFKYQNGPLVFDGCHVTGYCTVHESSAQMNIVAMDANSHNLTVKNCRNSMGGNWYFYHTEGLYIHNNDFYDVGIALNAVWNAEVHDNLYKNIGGYIIRAIPHHLPTTAPPPEPGLNHTGSLALLCEYDTTKRGLRNIRIFRNTFIDINVSAIAVERYDPYIPDMNNFYNVSVFENDFTAVEQFAVETLYTSILVDAKLNYWGSSTGPDAAANEGGQGVWCGASVVFKPWYCDESFATTGSHPNDCDGETEFPYIAVISTFTGISLVAVGFISGAIVAAVVAISIGAVVLKFSAQARAMSVQRKLITNVSTNPDYGSSVVWQTPESAAETVDLQA